MNGPETIQFLRELGDATLRCSNESKNKIIGIQMMCGVDERCDNNRELIEKLENDEYEHSEDG